MFAFILGFMVGGAVGAAIVLALSPEYQYQGGSEAPSDDPESGQDDEFRSRINEAIEEGKKAAAEKTSELEDLVRQRRGPGAEAQS